MASKSVASVSATSPIDLTASSSVPPSPSAPTIGSGTRIIDLDGVPEEPQVKRQKKSTSKCWDDFKLSVEWVEIDNKKVKVQWATCNHCGFKRERNSRNGTSLFLNHLKTHNLSSGQQLLKVGKNDTMDSSPIEPYSDQEASLRKFYLAIIMHEYPFNIVEHEYFVEFIKSLRPSFPIKSRITVRKELMAIFVEEKAKLYEYLKSVNCRFSTTMDMWTSNQNKGYMCVTVHWVDDNWSIQKRIISFMHVEGRHTGANLSDAFTSSITRWFIDKKMFSLSLDNAAANEVCVKDVIEVLNKRAPLICDGLFFHVKCANHILNLVARDGLQHIANAILNIRSFVLLVKCSPPLWEDFQQCAAQCDLDTKRGVSLDVLTRWNSTYHMLRDALYYRRAFDRLQELDKKRFENITPSADEWEKALTLCKCLKKFNDVTELLSGTSYPTANMFYSNFCDIRSIIHEWCNSPDDTIRNMAHSMSTKFEKYWKKSNVALAVASFLDPRIKKKAVEYYMRKFHGKVHYQAKVEEFVVVVKQIYQAYASSYANNLTTPASNTSISADSNKDDFIEDESDTFESFLYGSHVEGADDDDKSDLDTYMQEQPLRINKSSQNFDVLSWWKNQQDTYPILSLVARDVLAMQVSTVASELAFSAGGRVIDPFRSRLDPEMVEALICTKDWVIASRKGNH